MTLEDFEEIVKEEMIVRPDIMSNLTIAQARKTLRVFKHVTQISKDIGNRKLQKFEQDLLTKPRKLLLLDLDSYNGNSFI